MSSTSSEHSLSLEKLQRLVAVSEAFSPGAPINRQALFSGRTTQLTDVINAVTQRGQHVVLFGERGVGKTSLSNVIAEIMQATGFRSLRTGSVNCDGSDDFQSLWRKILQGLTVSIQKRNIGIVESISTEEFSLNDFTEGNLTPEVIRSILQMLNERIIIIVDELDRIEDKKATTLLADTIKTLSDHSVDVTLILVGVADSVEELIEKHVSIERCLVQVQMPRMSTDELRQIIKKGLGLVGLSMNEAIEKQIAFFSHGFPHFTHLLALNSAQNAVQDGRNEIGAGDFNAALNAAVRKTQHTIVNAYHKATSSARETLNKEVLLACALAPIDSLGFFATSDVRRPMSLIMGKPYEISAFSNHMNDFCERKKGCILQRRGSSRSYRYRFTNPLMQPYVLISGLSEAVITPEVVHQIQQG